MTTGLKDDFGRNLQLPDDVALELQIPLDVTDVAPIYIRSFKLGYDTAKAASNELGGAFMGGLSLGFTGAAADPFSGLLYLRNRWYDPASGSWLSEDPMGDRDSPNLYGFVGARPHEKTDPLGLQQVPGAAGPGVGEPFAACGTGAMRVFCPGQTVNESVEVTPEKWGFKESQLWAGGIGALSYNEEILEAYGQFGFEVYGAVSLRQSVYAGAELIEAGAARYGLWRAGVSAKRAASGAPAAEGPLSTIAGKKQFDATGLNPAQVDRAILKSIRRKSGATGTPTGEVAASSDQTQFLLEKVTSWRRDVHAGETGIQALSPELKGTLLHSSIQSRVRQLGIEGLKVNERIYGQSEYISAATGQPYSYRIPDFRLTQPGRTTIFDIKPAGTSLAGPQYNDFRLFGNTSDVRWIPYERY